MEQRQKILTKEQKEILDKVLGDILAPKTRKCFEDFLKSKSIGA